MLRLFFVCFLIVQTANSFAQQYSIALGVYTGFTIPYTLDKGIDQDPKYKSTYIIKAAPIGINFSMDYENVGFQISPGLYTAGQNYYVVNTMGGQDGMRNIDLKYFILPVSFKLHLIDLSFFRVSGLASASAAFLYDTDDKISHNYTKLKFPPEVVPSLPEEYVKEYDGIISPEISDQIISEKGDYRNMQYFFGLGLCADWNVTENWRVNFDVKVNYGMLEPRSDEYIQRINAYESIYDVPGRRTETFAHFSVGVSRFLNFDKADRDRQKGLKKNSRKFKPQKKLTPANKRR